jgi:hypothetical protein
MTNMVMSIVEIQNGWTTFSEEKKTKDFRCYLAVAVDANGGSGCVAL